MQAFNVEEYFTRERGTLKRNKGWTGQILEVGFTQKEFLPKAEKKGKQWNYIEERWC